MIQKPRPIKLLEIVNYLQDELEALKKRIAKLEATHNVECASND